MFRGSVRIKFHVKKEKKVDKVSHPGSGRSQPNGVWHNSSEENTSFETVSLPASGPSGADVQDCPTEARLDKAKTRTRAGESWIGPF